MAPHLFARATGPPKKFHTLFLHAFLDSGLTSDIPGVKKKNKLHQTNKNNKRNSNAIYAQHLRKVFHKFCDVL